MENLKAHSQNASQNFRVSVDWSLGQKDLNIEFMINGTGICTDKSFNQDHFDNWGLWEFDVTEVFIQKVQGPEDISNRYLEIQVSPLSQKFALDVFIPRTETRKIKDLEVKAHSAIRDGGFNSHFRIPYSIIPGSGEFLKASFCACLGEKGHRELFSTCINPEDKADFHRPDLFKVLGQI